VKVIVGRGNPGKKYEGTPHNIGFAAVEQLARRSECKFRKSLRFNAEIAKAHLGAEAVLLVKPQTYMNRSGDAVGSLLRYHKVSPADLIVLLDDVELEVGRIRIRPQGSSGGHNGLSSVVDHVGTSKFVRIRIGVGRGVGNEDLISHVLKPFPAAKRERVDEMTDRAADAVYAILESGVDSAMNRYNSAVQDES